MQNRSTNYQDHTGLMKKLAKKYHGRVAAAKLMSVDFQDVEGELAVAFTKAARAYKAEKGYAFTTYLGMVCQNHINNWLEDLMLEQYGCNTVKGQSIDDLPYDPKKTGVGLCSINSIHQPDDQEFDPYSLLPPSAPADTPLIERQVVGELLTDESLLEETREYLHQLIDPDHVINPKMLKRMKLQAGRVRAQVEARWGITLTNIQYNVMNVGAEVKAIEAKEDQAYA